MTTPTPTPASGDDSVPTPAPTPPVQLAYLAHQFEQSRPHLKALAYRMLGSHTESEDAVQETWIRLSRTTPGEVKTLPAWLTTVTSRICLNMLRSRTTRPEDPAGLHLPDPLIEPETTNTPEAEALLADSISLALLILLDTLSPTERVAFVLHDVFHLTFDEIAPVIDRSPANTRQLTSRARRRLHSTPLHTPGTSKRPHPAQRNLVNAFFTAARAGDLDTLVTLLDPNVELHADGGRTLPSATAHIQGAKSTAQRATLFRHPDVEIYPVRVNGTPGALVERNGTPTSVMAFTIHDNHITQIHLLLDPDRLAHIDFAAFH